jgi:hypothetical protein
MTPTDFRHRLDRLGLTLQAFARLTGVAVTTAAWWGRTRQMGERSPIHVPFPAWVSLLLDAWDVTGAPVAAPLEGPGRFPGIPPTNYPPNPPDAA